MLMLYGRHSLRWTYILLHPFSSTGDQTNTLQSLPVHRVRLPLPTGVKEGKDVLD